MDDGVAPSSPRLRRGESAAVAELPVAVGRDAVGAGRCARAFTSGPFPWQSYSSVLVLVDVVWLVAESVKLWRAGPG